MTGIANGSSLRSRECGVGNGEWESQKPVGSARRDHFARCHALVVAPNHSLLSIPDSQLSQLDVTSLREARFCS